MAESVNAVWDVSSDVLEKCATSGLVDLDPNGLVFRHALMRQAIAESLPSIRRKTLRMLAINGLVKCYENGLNVGFTHIVYHAELIEDIPTLLKFAPMAAQEAINLGAHQQAAMHYQSMLKYSEKLDAIALANVYDSLAYECHLIGQIEVAYDSCQKALNLWQEQADISKEIQALRRLSRYSWFLGRSVLAEDFAEQAIIIAEKRPDSIDLAMAYSNRAQLHMLKAEHRQTIQYAESALKIAEELQSFDVIAHALNNIGSARWTLGEEQGFSQLHHSLNLALEHNLEEHVARAYTNITCLAVGKLEYDLAKQYFDDGLAYCEKQNLTTWDGYMRGWLARQFFEQGQWVRAEEEVHKVLASTNYSLVIRQPALLAEAYIAVRRGNASAEELQKMAWTVAVTTAEIRRIVPTLMMCAEFVGLNDRLEDIIDDLKTYLEVALQHDDIWQISGLAFWLWQADNTIKLTEHLVEPHLAQVQGDWQVAADLWAEIGCPYEQAMALAEGDADSQKKALAIFEELGAMPAARRLRNKMIVSGVSGIPRRPNQQTLSNPAGLTQRQMQVLKLLVDGLTDAEIAECLYISPKTAGHHVSSILSKFDVRSRQEAALYAIQQRWIIPQSSTDKS